VYNFIDILSKTWNDKTKSVTERMEQGMDLSVKSAENVEYMIEQIKSKLRMVNVGAVKSTHFDGEMYEELKELYEMVMRKSNFSPSEMQAIVEELGSLRK
ncbi:MAG TPA: DUF1128 domain-containing protein, partial [Chondromyces sp.]|nr:DUF1128 domain-containing protein [Chondromyces sp.]